jgi:hypothetical protein
MKTVIMPPITRRIDGVKRDTYQPQRLGYPIYHTRSPRSNKAHPALRALIFGGSALVSISTILVAYHFLTTL